MTYSWIRNFNIAAPAIEHVIRVLHDFVLFLQSRHSDEAEAFRSAFRSSLDLKSDASFPKKIEVLLLLLFDIHSVSKLFHFVIPAFAIQYSPLIGFFSILPLYCIFLSLLVHYSCILLSTYQSFPHKTCKLVCGLVVLPQQRRPCRTC